MRSALFVTLLLSATLARAAETTTLPAKTGVFEYGYVYSYIDKQWGGSRQSLSLVEDIPRYEPGGGLQGVLSIKPRAEYRISLFQVLYGLTDRLVVGLNMPLVVSTRIDTNLTWTSGDYQPQLGRAYSEQDFWAFAQSMGQPPVPSRWTGNRYTLADSVLLLRYAPVTPDWFERLGVRLAGTLQLALPTGRFSDPEEAVAAGTTTWDLQYGDLELHAAGDRPFFIDGNGVARLSVGADLFFAWFRPKELQSSSGTINPLLLNYAPYIGDTYVFDPGDWLGATASIDLVPLVGPTRSSFLMKLDGASASKMPPLVTLNASYTYIATAQSQWSSQSPLWDYDREKVFQPGDKNIFRFTGTVSLLRLGLPLQFFGSFRSQEILPGRYTRPSNVLTGGARLMFKAG